MEYVGYDLDSKSIVTHTPSLVGTAHFFFFMFQMSKTIKNIICENLFSKCNWWLVGSHLRCSFCLFTPKFWEGDRDLQMIFCLPVRAVWVASGGGDTQNLSCYS